MVQGTLPLTGRPLSFGVSGTVAAVHVQVGDRVQAGQVLAEIDPTNLELQLENARLNLQTAQSKLAEAQTPASEEEIAIARANLEAAKASYDDLIAGPTEAELAAAQAALASAQAAYASAVAEASGTNTQLLSAQVALERAQIALNQAAVAYADAVAKNATDTSAEAAYRNAQLDYEQAKANYDALVATADSDTAVKVQQARAQLEQAQSNLAQLQSQASAAELASAQAKVIQAQNDLDELLAGPDALTVEAAQVAVQQAEIAVKQAELNLQAAQLTAPFDGVITEVNVVPGQNSGTTSTAFTIEDLDHLEVEISMAEVDVSQIAVGQQAQATLEALPDVTLEGEVIEIALTGVSSQGVVTYPVTVALSDPPDGIKTGMTANVSIIIDQRENVLMVPNRALKSLGGQRIVNVLFEGNTFQVPVTIGLSNGSMTEITSGLQEGDTVVLSTTSSSNQSRFGPGAGGAGFVMPMMR